MRGPGALGVYRNPHARGAAQRCHVGVVRPSQHSRADLHPGVGDGIMAFWGAPARRDDHVLRACCGALRAARRMQQLNADWRAQGRPAPRLRIGLHYAEVLVGNVGSSERLSYTVMGDGVNVAARLEGINKNFGTTICISDSVVEAVGSDIVARPIRKVQVKGRKHEFMIYELWGIRTSNDPELAPPDGFEKLFKMTQGRPSGEETPYIALKS